MADGNVNIRVALNGARETTAQAKRVATAIDGVDRSGRRTVGGLDGARRGSTALKGALAALAATVTTAGASLVAFGAYQAKKSVDATLELASATKNLNKNFGISNRDASTFLASAKARGVEYDVLVSGIQKLNTAQAAAVKKSGNQRDAFRTLGISMRQLRKDGKDPMQLLFDIGTGFDKLKGGIPKTNAAVQLFGKSWKKVLPAFAGGEKGMRGMMNSAEAVGAVLRNNDMKSVADLRGAQSMLNLTMLGLRVQLGKFIIPLLAKGAVKATEFLEAWTDRKKGSSAAAIREWLEGAVKEVKRFFDQWQKGKGTAGSIKQTFKDVATAVGGIIKVTAAVVGWFSKLYRTSGLVRTVFKLLFVSPIKYFIDAVKALNTAFIKTRNAVRTVRSALNSAFGKIRGTILSVARAVRSGLTAAFRFVGRAASAAGRAVRSGFVAAFRFVSRVASSAFGSVKRVISSIPSSVSRAFNRAKSAVTGFAGKLKSAFSGAVSFIKGLFSGLSFTLDIPSVLSKLGAPDKITISFAPGLADGGTVTAAGLAMVGERGPELLRLPRGARVEPLSRSKRGVDDARVRPLAAGAGFGGGTVVTKVYLDRRQIAEAIGGEVSSRKARR